MDQKKAEELIRRLAAALRGTELYSPTHPLVQRGIDALTAAATEAAADARRAIVIGFIGDEVVVDGTRLPRGTASLVGFARDLREREIEKITLTRGLTRDEVRHLVAALSDRTSPAPLPDRLAGARRPPRHARPHRRRGGQRRPGRHRRGAARLRHRGRDGRDAVERGEGRRPARPGRGAEDHRRPGAPRDAGPHVADGADRAEEIRQLHVHAHGERVGAGDGAGARAQHRRPAAARVRLRGADARHRQGQHAARGAEQAGQADQRGVRHHEAPRRRRRAHPAADAGDAGARADRRLRASPEAGSQRLSGEHRQPQAESLHDDRVDRRRVRRAAQQPPVPRRAWRPSASAASWASRATRRSTRRC